MTVSVPAKAAAEVIRMESVIAPPSRIDTTVSKRDSLSASFAGISSGQRSCTAEECRKKL